MKLIEAILSDRFDLQVDEGLFDDKKMDITKKFIRFCCSQLDLKIPFGCKLVANREENGIITTAYCMVGEDDPEIVIFAKGRLLVDVYRSIAHELTHRKQDEDGRINDTGTQGQDGSPIENEANAKAGEIIRKFGKKCPAIYEM